jgi:hypothetical protein
VLEIINGTWDINKKRAKLKAADELYRKIPVNPAPAKNIKGTAPDATPSQV